MPQPVTVTGSREVPYERRRMWEALTVLEPYCAVCDVSYVYAGRGAPGVGTRFVCVPGRLDPGARPPVGAPSGEILEWLPPERVSTRLTLTPETWTTTIELADAGPGATRVTITVGHEPHASGRLFQRLTHRLMRSGVREMVQRTVDGELHRLDAHVAQSPVV